jgi:hypothetical protein
MFPTRTLLLIHIRIAESITASRSDNLAQMQVLGAKDLNHILSIFKDLKIPTPTLDTLDCLL